VLEGIEAIVFRTVGVQPSLWDSVLPEALRRLPEELARVDALLADPVVLCAVFDPRMGRPLTPMETYLRLMFLKFRYRLGYEALCREVTDSISWRRLCRIPLDGGERFPIGHGTDATTPEWTASRHERCWAADGLMRDKGVMSRIRTLPL
jgi:IS5 family transposase